MGKKDNGIDGVRPALLVVDVQNYFFDRRSGAFLPGSARILPRISRLAEAARSRGWPVIHTVHCEPAGPGNLMASRWRRLPEGTEAKPFPGLRRLAGEAVVGKQHYSAFMGTDLAARLAKKGINDIILCGVMTHLCVDTTARHGFMLGFRPVIAADACCSSRPELHAAALACLGHGFAEISTVAKIIRSIHA
jgi:nicotinamidase-related amidase